MSSIDDLSRTNLGTCMAVGSSGGVAIFRSRCVSCPAWPFWILPDFVCVLYHPFDVIGEDLGVLYSHVFIIAQIVGILRDPLDVTVIVRGFHAHVIVIFIFSSSIRSRFDTRVWTYIIEADVIPTNLFIGCHCTDFEEKRPLSPKYMSLFLSSLLADLVECESGVFEQSCHLIYVWLTRVLNFQAMNDERLPRWPMYNLRGLGPPR